MAFRGICIESGNYVPDDGAFGYALSRVLNSEKEKAEFVEWYYSGSWIKEDEDE